jgi:hypothetical protein
MRRIAFTPDGTRALATFETGIATFDAVANVPAGNVPFDLATEGDPIGIAVMPEPPDPPTDLVAAPIAGNQAAPPTGSPLQTFTLAAPSGVFHVRVRGLVSGLRGEPSNEIRIFVNAPQPPAAPQSLLGLVNGSTSGLAWQNAPDGGAPASIVLDVTGSIATSLALPPGEAFSFAGVPAGTYTLSVRAVNGFGTSASSNAVTLSFPGQCSGVPQPPGNLRVSKAGSRLFVYWKPATAGPAPTGYVLMVTGSFTGSFATPERSLTGVVGPGTYHLSVAGENPCGMGPASNVETVTVP